MRAFHPESRMAWWSASESSGESVGQHLKPEALVERPGKEIRCAQPLADDVEIFVGCPFREALLEAKEGRECVIEPHACGGSAEQMVMAGKDTPYPARIADDRLSNLQFIH